MESSLTPYSVINFTACSWQYFIELYPFLEWISSSKCRDVPYYLYQYRNLFLNMPAKHCWYVKSVIYIYQVCDISLPMIIHQEDDDEQWISKYIKNIKDKKIWKYQTIITSLCCGQPVSYHLTSDHTPYR